MLMLKPQPLDTVPQIHTALQNAIKLELATIPPYLTAYYTLLGSSPNVQHVRRIIKDIVIEEMMHMTIAANILIATGGIPDLKKPENIPTYPGPPPMGIGDDDGPLIVGLKRYSKDLVRDVFMAIEEPEDPHKIEVMRAPAVLESLGTVPPERFDTIGEFYASVKAALAEAGDDIFQTPNLDKQVASSSFGTELFAISDYMTASKAIDIIVEQGEGTTEQPIDFEGDVPHYYLYESLVRGYMAVKVSTDVHPLGLIYDESQPISIDEETEVVQMADNPPLIDLSDPENAEVSTLSDQCDQAYTDLLNTIHDAFNGQPSEMFAAIGQMHLFGSTIRNLLETEIKAGPHAGMRAGPRFKLV